jgi:hypothetical protein
MSAATTATTNKMEKFLEMIFVHYERNPNVNLHIIGKYIMDKLSGDTPDEATLLMNMHENDISQFLFTLRNIYSIFNPNDTIHVLYDTMNKRFVLSDDISSFEIFVYNKIQRIVFDYSYEVLSSNTLTLNTLSVVSSANPIRSPIPLHVIIKNILLDKIIFDIRSTSKMYLSTISIAAKLTKQGYTIVSNFNKLPEDVFNEECPVCMDSLQKTQNVMILECNHGYHTHCFDELCHNIDRLSCSNCRAPISNGCIVTGKLSPPSTSTQGKQDVCCDSANQTD